MMGAKERRSLCPISFGLDLVGDRWTLLVLRDMLLFDRHFFSDFVDSEGMATNVLSDRLARLESAGVLHREREGKRVRYDATEKGRALAPVIQELMLWGIQYDDQTPVNEEYRNRIVADGETVRREVTEAIHQGTFTEYRARAMGVHGSS